MRVLRAAIALAMGMAAGTAFAHPVHEVVQNAYLTLSPGMVSIEMNLTAGPLVAGKVIRELDRDLDRRISTAEARAYADGVLAQSRLTIDGRPLAIRTLSVDVPSYAALLGAHGTIRIVAAAARLDRRGAATLAYRNGYSPAESRCDANIFIKASGPTTYQVQDQAHSPDGRTLVVHYSTSIG